MLDWGCGSGVGSRCVLDHFGADGFSALSVHDHAPLAGAFAIARAKERFPRLDVGLASMTAIEGSEPIGTLIVSHVLNELTPDGELSLAAVIRRSESILWVEPGAHAASRRLGRFRESLLTEFRVVSPCSHQSQCGMLTPENARHWCHFFARPPREIFTDPGWSKFARRAGIDLRSLPYSYLILDRRPVNPGAKSVSGLTRVIGEPRVYKGFAKVFGCDETGVRERMLQKRDVPERFAEMKNGDAGALEHWTVINDRIVACKKLESK
jgi:ribosomal protein RSM22 (predicted rRNA methylase)